MTKNLPVFVCPTSLTPLRRVTGALLSKLNQLCRKKRLVSVQGSIIKGPLSAFWIRDERDLFYVERKKIPILLVSEAVAIQDIGDRELRAEFEQEFNTWNLPSHQ